MSNPCLRVESWIGARRTVSVPVHDRIKQSIRHHRHPVQRKVVLVVNMYFVLPDSQSPHAVSKRNKGESTSSWMLASNRALHIFIIRSWKGVKKYENVVSRTSSMRRYFNFAIECIILKFAYIGLKFLSDSWRARSSKAEFLHGYYDVGGWTDRRWTWMCTVKDAPWLWDTLFSNDTDENAGTFVSHTTGYLPRPWVCCDVTVTVTMAATVTAMTVTRVRAKKCVDTQYTSQNRLTATKTQQFNK